MRRFVLLLLPISVLVIFGLFFFRPKDAPVLVSLLGNPVVPAVENLRNSFIVYGYLPYWNIKKAQFPETLTHVSYFSVPIASNGHLFPDEEPSPGYRLFKKGILADLKAQAPQAQIELTLTMMDQEAIPTLLSTPSAALTLLSDLRQIIREEVISGVNIDVEYVRPVDDLLRSKFTALIKMLYLDLKQRNPQFQLSVAVLADSAEKKRLTDIKSLAPYTDRLVIMAYDFHRKSSPTSGANAPLYGKGDEYWSKNIMASAKMFTDVVPARKLILGVPFYGYEWSVLNNNPYNFTLPDSGMVASYDRITKLLASGKATRHWDSASFTPYLLYQDEGQQQQIYYEDSESLAYKLELVKQAGFGGIAIWALGYEGQTQELWNTIQTSLK